ncbi:MucB/RseB C-terminal domain-containing protein [Orbaceae bacterium ac157xtp]
MSNKNKVKFTIQKRWQSHFRPILTMHLLAGLFVFPTITFAQTTQSIQTSQSAQISNATSNLDANSDEIEEDENNVITILNKMRNAATSSNYQIYFSLQNQGEFTNTFKYEYISSKSGNSARLVYLEGVNKEIILHDNIVSYLQSTESVSFSIASSHIIEAYPELVYNDFSTLTDYYDLILMGKAKTANRSSYLVRIVSKDKDRYHYLLWIDDESYLPLRIDLLDLNSRIIKQLKVISVDLDYDATALADEIKQRDYPTLFPIEKEENDLDDWQVTWLPNGFKQIASYNINFYHGDIDTRLYSDGLFSFTVNVSTKDNSKSAHVFEQGGRNIYTTNLNDFNVVVIGNLPSETIEKVAQSIKPK